MSYIHLPLFLSCLILTQSSYSMERKELEKRESRRRSSKDMVKEKKTRHSKSSSTSSPNSTPAISPTVTPVGSPTKQDREIPTINIMSIDKNPQQKFIDQQITSPKDQQPSSPRTEQPTSPRDSQSSKHHILSKMKSVELLPKLSLSTEKNKKQYAATTDEMPTKSSKQTNSNLFLTKSDSTIITSPKSSQTKMSLIKAIYDKDIELMQKIMLDPDYDINLQNKFGLTPLHCAVLSLKNNKENEIEFKKAQKIINLMLIDPRTDSTKKNQSLLTAAQLIQGTDNLVKDRQNLFGHYTLVQTSWIKAFILLMDAQITKKQIDNKDITKTVSSIIDTILDTQLAQKEKLPQEALLPSYATNTFIENVVKIRLDQMEQILPPLIISEVHKAIQSLLFNVEIDTLQITKAQEDIQKLIKKSNKKSKQSLPSYLPEDLFFSVIISCLKKEKAEFQKLLEIAMPLQPITESNKKEKLFVLSNSKK